MFTKFHSLIFISFCCIFSYSHGINLDLIQKCSICLQPLNDNFLIDTWGNKFHTKHKHNGIFCNSCSRIISQGITKGGYKYDDGRYLCSLCQLSAIKSDSMVQNSYQSVIKQIHSIGIKNISSNISIKLINLIELNNKKGGKSHKNLKGVTNTYYDEANKKYYEIFILFGLPEIEFESVLAHELFHVWLYENPNSLSTDFIEAFCNLGSAMIYKNNNTHFSQIHLQAMEDETDSIYGINYQILKNRLNKYGWKELLKHLTNIK